MISCTAHSNVAMKSEAASILRGIIKSNPRGEREKEERENEPRGREVKHAHTQIATKLLKLLLLLEGT